LAVKLEERFAVMKARSTEKKKRARQAAVGGGKSVTLKEVAEYLKLSPATVSLVLNRSPAAGSIPAETQERVFAAARELAYRPNYLARSLRSRRSFLVGVLVPEISEPYAGEVMSGIEGHLLQEGYHYLVTSHRRRSNADLLEDSLRLLEDRAVEGLILVATEIEEAPLLPAVAVSGHTPLPGVTNVVIDHDRAAFLTLSHLMGLGHERIAFFKGQPGSSDTEDRWRAILETSASLGLEIRPELTLQLSGDAAGEVFSPEDGYQEGYTFGRKLLAGGSDFTALFAFDDVSAIGATRAFLDAGLRVPEEVSVVGFDDIQSAAFQNPSLTTVRQPLRQMGEIAARILLRRVAGEEATSGFVTVEPELVVRGSTGPAPHARRHGGVNETT
jgi:LacI family transcriptional regulator, galactose operon repressor